VAIPTVTGAIDTNNTSSTLAKIDMAERILLLQPSANPLTVFTKNLSKKAAHNTKFQWAEDDLEDRFDATTNTALVGATSIPVAKDIWSPDDLIYNTRTAELMRVTAGLSGGFITVVRGVGSTAAAINNGDELMKAGASSMEHDLSRVSRSYNPSIVANYTQIFKRTMEISESERHSDWVVEDDEEDYQRGKKGIEHARDIEHSFIVGHPNLDTTGAHPRRVTGGALHYIATNQTAVGGTMSEATFFAALRPGMRFGSVGSSGAREKLGLASPLVVDVLNGYPRGKVQVTDQGRTVYGVKVVDFISPHGTLHVATHWVLGDSTKFAGTLIGLDTDQLKYRFLANRKGSRDTAYYPNRQENDRDGVKGEFITEAGLQFGLEKTHFRIDGVTG
jgi:hypothetical protein